MLAWARQHESRQCPNRWPNVRGMDDAAEIDVIAALLHEAAETHHQVFRISDGSDDDWASWYADWLVRLSELPQELQSPVVRSELTYMLVTLDHDYLREQPTEPWERYYASRLVEHFRR